MRILPTSKPLVFVTMGDPAGIGPEVIMKSMASSEIRELAVFVVVGDARVMEGAASSACRKNLVFHRFTAAKDIRLNKKHINIVDPGFSKGEDTPGVPTEKGSIKALKCLEIAVRMIRKAPRGAGKAMVTAPVSKEGIARVSPGFRGHTEYLQTAYSSKLVTMVMVGENMCVVPVTRHVPLKDVPAGLSADLIVQTLIQVSKNRLLISGKKNPRITVCGLNPHCGEGGKIGNEEIDMIAPAVKKAKGFYNGINGPLSADTVFYKAMKKEVDIVIAMYHDQGLAPFKMVEFDVGVNLTLGLGDVRTSPDHGTAFDIAGKGIAGAVSMERAIKLAVKAARLKWT